MSAKTHYRNLFGSIAIGNILAIIIFMWVDKVIFNLSIKSISIIALAMLITDIKYYLTVEINRARRIDKIVKKVVARRKRKLAKQYSKIHP